LADKRAFDIPDVYGASPVSSPAVSPDGSQVAFCVRSYDVAAGSTWSEIWIVGVDGQGLRQLTSAKKFDSQVQFATDGKSLLFVSNRSGSSQLWTIALDGGEPRKLSDYAPGIDGPVLSPDGKWIAFSAEIWPDIDFDGASQAAHDHAREQGRLNVRMSDSLLYRHWTSWDEGKFAHVLLMDAKTGAVVRDLTPGRFDSPPFMLGGGRGFAFSPDGTSLVFMSNHERNQAHSTNSDLWSVALDGPASPHNLTDANAGWDGQPLFSPDGKSIAYISQAQAGNEADLKRLAVLDLGSSTVRYLTSREGFDQMIGDMRWSRDGRSIFFQAEVHGRSPIFRISAEGGAPSKLHEHGTIDAWELLGADDALVYTRRTVAEPAELFVRKAAQPATRLTQFNAAYEAQIDLRPAEELWVEGEDNTKIHVFLVKPHGFDPKQKYPLILNVHGGPQSQWADAFRGDWQVYPGKGYVVAFANPTGSTGYGQKYCDGIGKDWGGRVYRDLMRVSDDLAKLPYVDAQRMGAMGWSYGGYMMMWMQGHTERFKCQAAMMGLYDLRSFYGATEELWFPKQDFGGMPWNSAEYERWSPSNFVEAFKTPALVITGELDFRVPYTQSLQYFTALQERGVDSRLVVFPDAGHWPGWQEMLFYYAAHVDWFHKYLGGEALGRDLEQWVQLRAMPAAQGTR
jgi:dipeptidyl aminopeptidase/acylaminoacyl peptidase